MLKIGDLVSLSHGLFAKNPYADKNPGIVISLSDSDAVASSQKSAEVIWSNNRITTEWQSLLQKIGE